VNRTDTITDLAAALAKAQGEISGAKKDAENPHFRSKYADLASVWDAIRAPLAKNGLSVVQTPRLVAVGESTWMVEVESTLLHSTGQMIGDTLAVPVTKVDAQGVGSAITYARRYSLMALVGVAPEDDDANAAVGPSSDRVYSKPKEEIGNVTVKVSGVVQRPTGQGGEIKYVITGDDRQTYQTFVKAHAETAKSAKEAGQAVAIQYRQETFGRSVASLEEVAAAEPPV
jgi:ERF superfamily protein